MRILLAIDDSKFSQEAIRSLLKQVQPKGNLVRVLHVIAPISAYISAGMTPHLVPYVAEVEEDRRKQAKTLVQGAARKLRKAGFRAKEIVDAGDPKVKIIDRAAEWHADLIVLGSHGWKGLSRFLMGSVSEAVTRHAGCSVEVVRSRNTVKRARRRSSQP
jgi:nucleotide-binding universal stress UspA family protein